MSPPDFLISLLPGITIGEINEMGNFSMDKIRVLFLCVGNSARSLMAEALLRSRAGDRFDAFSAGLEPKGVNAMTVRALESLGVSPAGLSSKAMNVYIGKTQFDYIINVCADDEKNCPFFPGKGARLHWEFEDPAAFRGNEAQTLAKFQEICGQIDARIRAWLSEMQVTTTD